MNAGEAAWCSGGDCPHPSPSSFVSKQVIPGFLCTHHTIFDWYPPCFTLFGHAFPGVGANICQLHVSLAQIFELDVWLPSWVSAHPQFAMQHDLKDVTRTHSTDEAQPPEMSLTEKGEKAWAVNVFKNLCIVHSVLPGNVEDAPQAVEVESVKHLFLTGIHCPDLTSI